jgi:hypothetical protein
MLLIFSNEVTRVIKIQPKKVFDSLLPSGIKSKILVVLPRENFQFRPRQRCQNVNAE